jgi:hypothetical protein
MNFYAAYFYNAIPFLEGGKFDGMAYLGFVGLPAVIEYKGVLDTRDNYLNYRKEWRQAINQLAETIRVAKSNRKPGPNQAEWQATVEAGRKLVNRMMVLLDELKAANKLRYANEKKAASVAA